MQAKSLILSSVLVLGCALPVAAENRGGERPGEGWRRGGPSIYIEPDIDLSRRSRPNVDDPNFIMAEISQCSAAGMLLFVDCLRQNHGSIMIRRLEACVGSETIPPDLQRVAVCIPPVPPTAGQ